MDEQDKGKKLGARCGHPTCSMPFASMFDNDRQLFVCAPCAEEQNRRAEMLGWAKSCIIPPSALTTDPWPDFAGLLLPI
jgi:hypothetical protein